MTEEKTFYVNTSLDKTNYLTERLTECLWHLPNDGSCYLVASSDGNIAQYIKSILNNKASFDSHYIIEWSTRNIKDVEGHQDTLNSNSSLADLKTILNQKGNNRILIIDGNLSSGVNKKDFIKTIKDMIELEDPFNLMTFIGTNQYEIVASLKEVGLKWLNVEGYLNIEDWLEENK